MSNIWTDHHLFKNDDSDDDYKSFNIDNIDEMKRKIELLESQYKEAVQFKEKKEKEKKQRRKEIESIIEKSTIQENTNKILELEVIIEKLKEENNKYSLEITELKNHNKLSKNTNLNVYKPNMIFPKALNDHPLHEKWYDMNIEAIEVIKMNEEFIKYYNYKVEYGLLWATYPHIYKIVIQVETYPTNDNNTVTYIIFKNSDENNLSNDWFEKILWYIMGTFQDVLEYLIISNKVKIRNFNAKNKPKLNIKECDLKLPFYVQKKYIEIYIKIIYAMIMKWDPPQS